MKKNLLNYIEMAFVGLAVNYSTGCIIPEPIDRTTKVVYRENIQEPRNKSHDKVNKKTVKRTPPVQRTQPMQRTPIIQNRAEMQELYQAHPIQREDHTNNYQPVRRDVSDQTPNENYRVSNNRRIDSIVLHTTEGTGRSAINTFLNPANQVSSHYVIMEDGEIVTIVNPINTAYHCRGHNTRSIGIEIAGYHNRRINDNQIRSTAILINELRNNYGIGIADIYPHSALDPSRRRDPGQENMQAILNSLDQ